MLLKLILFGILALSVIAVIGVIFFIGFYFGRKYEKGNYKMNNLN